jgi:hypothetical protein
MFEIESGKLAEQKGNAQEKTFARQMVIDHAKTSGALKSMVRNPQHRGDAAGAQTPSRDGQRARQGAERRSVEPVSTKASLLTSGCGQPQPPYRIPSSLTVISPPAISEGPRPPS